MTPSQQIEIFATIISLHYYTLFLRINVFLYVINFTDY